MGITRHCFNWDGNSPVDKLRLKICDKGTTISGPINLIIFVDTPLMSQLFFGLNFFYNFEKVLWGGISEKQRWDLAAIVYIVLWFFGHMRDSI